MASRMAIRLCFLLALLCGLPAVDGALAEPLSAGAVRIGIHPDRTRFVVELPRPVEFSIFTAAEPYRVVVDLEELGFADGKALPAPAGLIGALKLDGQAGPGSRLVLGTKAPVRVAGASIYPPSAGLPYRLVLDLVEVTPASFVAKPPPARIEQRQAARPPAALPAPRPQPGKRPPTKPVIVIDAGHGGVDPGAVGIGGIFEKDLVLDYAVELRRRLEQTGRYRVVLTRDRDVFLRLQERVQVARKANAQLFLSLHADSIGSAEMRGGAVYTLSETASDEEAAALAAKENKADLIGGVPLDDRDSQVTSILIDLAQRETMNYSARFTNRLLPELARRNVTMRQKPHRFAGFRVLKAPDVPSILLELGYLSNREDAQFVTSNAGRAAITAAVVDAIDRYFAERRD